MTHDQMRALIAAKPYNLFRGIVASSGKAVSLRLGSGARMRGESTLTVNGAFGAFPDEQIPVEELTGLESRPDDAYTVVMQSDARVFRGVYEGKLRVFTRAEHFNFGRGYLMHQYDPVLFSAETEDGGYLGIVSTSNMPDLKPAPEFGQKPSGLIFFAGSTASE